ncbi:MAG: trypsin-like serine protease [Polyangiales bacterium]
MKNSVDRHLLAVLSFLSVLVASQPTRANEVDSRSDYIVNGSPTEAGELRGTVALLFAPDAAGPADLPRRTLWNQFRCSAVLIAPTVAVTAAHCVTPDPPPIGAVHPADSLYVAAGVRTLDDVWRAEVTGVRELIVHEQFLEGFSTDIALLRLDSPITVLNPVRLLPDSEDLVGEVGTAQGYGLRASAEDHGLLDQQQYASFLNEANTPIEEVSEFAIVTSEGVNGSGICFGDSGGPLYIQRDNALYAAGITSAFRGYTDSGPICGAGAFYVPLVSYTDWILENAPEAIPAQLGAGGGCSAASMTPAPTGIWFAAILAALALISSRRVLLGLAAFALLGTFSTGCGSDGDANPSLCSDTYDPTGDFCDPGVERIDLREAERRARGSMPSEALLWSAVGGADETVNPDGEAESWFLRYFIPGRIELPDALFRSVTVYASGNLRPYQELGTVQCIPTEPMLPVDSRDLIHDAIRRLEQAFVSAQLGEEGLLRVFQSHRCAREPDNWGGVEFANTFLYYDDDGSYLGTEGAP